MVTCGRKIVHDSVQKARKRGLSAAAPDEFCTMVLFALFLLAGLTSWHSELPMVFPLLRTGLQKR
jgi:hypothetical protein